MAGRVKLYPSGSDYTGWSGPVAVAALTDLLPLTRVLAQLGAYNHVHRLLFQARSATAGTDLVLRVVWGGDSTRPSPSYVEARAGADGYAEASLDRPVHEHHGLQAQHLDGTTTIADVEWQVWALVSR